jgi:hypothetical protein
MHRFTHTTPFTSGPPAIFLPAISYLTILFEIFQLQINDIPVPTGACRASAAPPPPLRGPPVGKTGGQPRQVKEVSLRLSIQLPSAKETKNKFYFSKALTYCISVL